MTPNCEGCKEELEWSYEYQEMSGLHLADNPFKKGHFHMIMVDDKGNIKVN